MTLRRTIIQGLGACAAGMPLLLAPRLGWAQAAGSRAIKLHALIVGINSYPGRIKKTDPKTGQVQFTRIRALKGCLNDARAIEAMVRPMAASVRILLDANATRPAFDAAWRETLAQAAAGDTILLTFAGHGGLEQERQGDNKPTGQNPSFLFSRFDTSAGGGPLDRILSYEIRALLEGALARRVRVVFVADSCHSGTLTRSVDPRDSDAISERTVRDYDVLADLAAGLGKTVAQQPKELPNVVFFSGSQDHETVPEVELKPGQWHGALSVAFSRALGGLASSSADGAVTGSQLQSYVQAQVRLITDSGQHPAILWPTHDIRLGVGPNDVLFATRNTASPPPAAAPLDSVRLRIRNMTPAAAKSVAAALAGVTLIEDGTVADVVWDAANGDCIAKGARIAAAVAATELQPVVNRIKALPVLVRLASNKGLALRILLKGERLDQPASVASDAVQIQGTMLTCAVSGLRYPHLVVFNLTGNGTVQFLYPSARHNDPVQVPVDKPYLLPPNKVEPPYGSDHIVAVASAEPANVLIAELAKLNGSRRIELAVAALETFAARPNVQVGFQGIYTAE